MVQKSEPSATQVSAIFSRIVRRYDLMNRLMTFGQDQRWRRLAARLAELEPGNRILDLGAGTGDLGLALKRAQASVQVIGADFNPLMLTDARGKGINELVTADALQLPFKDVQFDALASGFLVRNVIDLDLALGEMKRVLKPGGRLVVLDTTRPRRNILLPFIRFYMRIVIPLLGKLVTGDREAYRYLPASTEHFLYAEDLAGRMQKAGFRNVGFRRYMLGTIAIHWGRNTE